MRVGDHERVGAKLLQLGADAREFLLRFLARVAQLVQHDRAERWRRPVGPDGVDRIVGDRNKARSGRRASLGEPLGAVDRMQPGRIAEFLAGRQVGFDPRRRRPFDQMLDGENLAVDLLGDLHLIAAVDENHGAIGQHDRQARGAGEAGQPGEPLGAGRHVFVLVLVGARHDEAVEAAPRQFGAQRRDPGRGGAGFAAIIERLEMGFEHAEQCRSKWERVGVGRTVTCAQEAGTRRMTSVVQPSRSMRCSSASGR